MDARENSRKNYNRIADDYDNTFDGRFTVRFKQLLLEELSVNSGDRILDVACGNGTLLKMLSGKYDIKGYGIDISEKMIENAKVKCPDMEFRTGSCESIPFADNTFDIITVCAAYHHFPDVKAFAEEASRIIKPQGLLYIAEVYYSAVMRTLLSPLLPLSGAGDVKFYSPAGIRNNFEAHGFEQIGFRREKHIQIVELKKK